MRQLGRLSQASRSFGWKEARESYRNALIRLQDDFAISPALEAELSNAEAFIGGDEHLNIHIPSEPARIFKLTAHDQFGVKPFFDPHDVTGDGRHFLATGNDDPFFYLQRWQILNSIGNYQSRFEGIVPPEKEHLLPRFCMSQPYLNGFNPAQSEISSSLLPFNYTEVSLGAYFSEGNGILLTDTFPRNVRIAGGHPALFDAVASQPEGPVLDWLLQKCR